MQPQEQNPYSFITNPSSQQGPKLQFSQNPKQRIIISVVFVSVIIIAIVVFSIFSSIGGQKNDDLGVLSAYQTEMLRVSNLGIKDAKDPSTKSQIATLQAFITSDNNDIATYSKKIGFKISKTQNASQLNPSTDKTLQAAAQTNNYDKTLLDSINKLSSSYKSQLQKSLNDTTAINKTALLKTAAANILTYEE